MKNIRPQILPMVLILALFGGALLTPLSAAFCEGDPVNQVDPLGLEAYYADYPRHQLAAEDQLMSEEKDDLQILDKARRNNDDLKWGPVDIGILSIVAVQDMEDKNLLNKMLFNSKEATAQFYGHGGRDRLIMNETGRRIDGNQKYILTTDDLRKYEQKIVDNKYKIKIKTLESYACGTAFEEINKENFASVFNEITGVKVTAHKKLVDLIVRVYIYDAQGKRIIDDKITKPYFDLAQKIRGSMPDKYGVVLYTIDDFKADWKKQYENDAKARRCAEAYWDVFIEDYDSRVSYPR